MPSLNLRNALKRNPNRPTLKQRAAALKASAGRVMRRRAVEVTPAAPGADPRLTAMVAEMLEARRKLNDPAVPDGPEADALGERETDLCMAVHRFPARSIHDMAAKLPFLREEAEDAGRGWDARRGVPFEASVPGAAWAGLLRDIQHLAGSAPDLEATPDPVHALIAEHRAAYAEWEKLSRVWADQVGGTPKSVAADAARAPSGDREIAALKALTQARPTTFAGLLALAEYLPDALRQVDQGEDAEPVLRNVAAFLRAIAPGPAGPIDGELIALGGRFDVLHAAWRRAVEANREPSALFKRTLEAGKSAGLSYETAEAVAYHLPGVDEAITAEQDAFEALEPIMREIFVTPARTAAGLAVKARATVPAMWMGGNYEEDAADPSKDWERRAVHQLIEAVCAAAGVDWRGQPVTPSEIQPKA